MEEKKGEEDDDEGKADVLIEFLEVAFHSILYLRNVYPKSIFYMRKKYQVPVFLSRQPEVNDYINESLKTAKFLIKENGMKSIFLTIVNGEEEIVESHCFDIDESKGNGRKMDFYYVRLEENFRECLLKLSVIGEEKEEEKLKKSNEDKSFRILIKTKENSSIKLNENPELNHFPWIEKEEKRENFIEEEKCKGIFPIKTIDTSIFKLNVYVEK